jgi:glycosyltransferase involved in cell wall biosynthesis
MSMPMPRAQCSDEFFADFTYVSRRASGMERVAKALFSPAALAPLKVRAVRAGRGRPGILAAQQILIPLLARRHPDSMFLFTGYPPPFLFPFRRTRAALYVHDIFLITGTERLNFSGRYYLAPQFRRALKLLRLFFCNSADTAAKLRPVCHDDAEILLFRPGIENVFALEAGGRELRPANPDVFRIVSLGTVEPRKNYTAALRIHAALAARLGRRIEYHIIGRRGWDEVWTEIEKNPLITPHGYLDEPAAKRVIEAADLVLCTSHEEGLGLPAIEMQYAGLPVAAPDAPIFRETLGRSAVLIDPTDAATAARRIAEAIAAADWRARFAAGARDNIARWNALARADREAVIARLAAARTEATGGGAPC